MQHSVINRAIEALQTRYAGDNAAAVATVIVGFKAAQAANKGQNASLFSGLLDLAGQGATPYTVRKVGANIRQSVTAELRKAAGLPAVKAKGEKGGPDFSTASVYAGIVADALDARRDDPDTWATAMDEIVNATETPAPVHEASGLVATKGALQRAVAEFHAIRAAREAHQYPALTVTAEGEENDPAILRTALHASQRRVAELADELAALQDTLRAMREAHAAQSATAE